MTDIVVAFDTTGSMSPCIREVRRRLGDLTDVLFNKIHDLRVQLVAFGDYCDMPRDYFSSVMTDYPESLQKFLSKNHSTSGGDFDEYYELVLKRVREETPWREGNKILILIGDATPHKVGYSYRGTKYTLDWKEEALHCAKDGIQIYPIQALNRSQSNHFYKSLATLTNGIKVDLHQLSHVVEFVTAVSLRASDKIDELQTYEKNLDTSNRSIRGLFATLLNKKVAFDTIYSESGEELVPVSPSRFQTFHVEDDYKIKLFVEDRDIKFKIGRGFYQFTKTETIQENKEVVLRDKEGNFFTGDKARELIGVPIGTRARLRPTYLRKYDVFVQSTSWNRKLKRGTDFLYEIDY